MNLQSIQAADLARPHNLKPCRIEQRGTSYRGILRHFTQAVDGVYVFVTSADNGVTVGSLKLTPEHEIEVTP